MFAIPMFSRKFWKFREISLNFRISRKSKNPFSFQFYNPLHWCCTQWSCNYWVLLLLLLYMNRATTQLMLYMGKPDTIRLLYELHRRALHTLLIFVIEIAIPILRTFCTPVQVDNCLYTCTYCTVESCSQREDHQLVEEGMWNVCCYQNHMLPLTPGGGDYHPPPLFLPGEGHLPPSQDKGHVRHWEIPQQGQKSVDVLAKVTRNRTNAQLIARSSISGNRWLKFSLPYTPITLSDNTGR